MLNFLIDWLPSRLNGMWNLDVFLLAYILFIFRLLWVWEVDDHRILNAIQFFSFKGLKWKESIYPLVGYQIGFEGTTPFHVLTSLDLES